MIGTVTVSDHQLAERLAIEAGLLLVDLRPDTAARKAADASADDLILAALAQADPSTPVLSEESSDDPVRLTSSRVWIVDPLDGTNEYREVGRTDWAVHVALAVDGHAVAGAVALPALGTCLSTASPPPTPAGRDRRPRIMGSRTRPPAFLRPVAASLGAELVAMGSAGAKVAAVITGDADAYVHGGGQYEWDSAAPVAVALAAGLHASRLDGSPLRYNRPDPWLPDLVVCRPELADALLEAIAEAIR